MDATGTVRASAERAYETHHPYPGWAEQNPNDWIMALRLAIADLRIQHANLIDSLMAIGACSAAHIPVLLDDADRVICPAILWSDQRSEAEVAELQKEFGAKLAHITLNEAGCTWTLPQLRWISKHEPEKFSRARSLLSSKDYLLLRGNGMDMMSAVMGSGVVKSQVWSQIITDVLEMNTHTIRHGDSAFGAGILVATAVGMFGNIRDAVARCVKADRTLAPDTTNYDSYRRAFARYQETGHFLDAMARKYARYGRH